MRRHVKCRWHRTCVCHIPVACSDIDEDVRIGTVAQRHSIQGLWSQLCDATLSGNAIVKLAVELGRAQKNELSSIFLAVDLLNELIKVGQVSE